MLVRAKDFFILPDPTEFTLNNRVGGYTSEQLVCSFLQKAMLGFDTANAFTGDKPYTDYQYHISNFSYAVGTDTTSPGFAEQFKSSYDVIKELADLLNFHVWCDYKGGIHFKFRPHYPEHSSANFPPNNGNPQDPAGPSPSFLNFSKANANILSAKYSTAPDSVRNGMFVQGAYNLQYSAYQSPPSMPNGGVAVFPVQGVAFQSLRDSSNQTYPRTFTNGAFLGTPFLISAGPQSTLSGKPLSLTSDDNIVKATAINIQKLNRLPEVLVLEVPGDYRIHALLSNDGSNNPTIAIAAVSSDFDSSGIMPEVDSSNGDWLVLGVSTVWGRSAYHQEVTLARAR